MGAHRSTRQWPFFAFSILLILSSLRIEAAQLYLVDGSGVVAVDSDTGARTPTGIAWPGGGIYQGESTTDLVGRRIFTIGSSNVPGQSVLTTISLLSGSTSQVNVSGSSAFIEYDPVTDLVYAVQGSNVVAINPETGAVTPTIAWPGGGIYQGESAIDVAGRRIFTLGAGVPGHSVLTTISLLLGTASQVNVNGSSAFIEYDPVTQLVYAVQGAAVVTINPGTGAVTPTSISWPGGGIYQGESTTDVVARRIFTFGASSVPGQSALTTISLASGSTSRVNVVGSSAVIEFVPAAAPIPTLGPELLLALVGALALLGLLATAHRL